MKTIILLIVILLIIFYMSPVILKRSFKKPSKKASEPIPTDLISTDYFQPKPVWTPSIGTPYKTFQGISTSGVEVSNTGNCNVYTYGSALVTENTTKGGAFNPLTQVVYTKPNVENAFQDFVDGKSQIIGKKNNTRPVTCIDADQVEVKHSEKICDTKNTQNSCLSSYGFEIPSGSTFSYNQACTKTPCVGTVGCLSLNFNVIEGTILPTTTCITIEEIAINTSDLNTYYLDFYLELNIIKQDKNVPVGGPFPIKFGFASCNTNDPRQILKFVNYTYSSKTKSFTPSPSGSYGSIIFRGLDSYLDVDSEGNFILRPIDKIEDTIKWIFVPEISLTENNITTTQRCSLLTTNMNTFGGESIAGLLEGYAGGEAAKYIGGGITATNRLLSAKAGKFFSAYANQQVTVDNQLKLNEAFQKQQGVKETNLDAPEEEGEGGEDDFADVDFSSLESSAGDEMAVAISSYAGTFLSGLSTLLDAAGPIGAVVQLWWELATVLPNPSYFSPPFLSLLTPDSQSGIKVIPTNYPASAGVATSGPSPGALASTVNFNTFCVPSNWSEYPPYYLQATTGNTKIQPEFINYKFEIGPTMTAGKFFSFGGRGASGLFIWDSPNNLKGIELNRPWTDGETVWMVNDIFSESLGFPQDYFTQDLGSVIAIENPQDSSQPPPVTINGLGTSYYTKSPLKTISAGGLSFSASQIKLKNKPGRIAGLYYNVPSSTTGSGSGATFNVTVSYNPGPSANPPTSVQDVEIFKAGQNYNIGDIVSIDGTCIGASSNSLGVSFSVIRTETYNWIFKALSQEKDGYYYPEDKPENTIQGGFETIGQILSTSSTTNSFVIAKNNINGNLIANGGFGYKPGDSIYLAQYDQLNSRFTKPGDSGPISSSDLTKFIKLEVSEVNKTGYGLGELAPTKLATGSSFFVNYNFMENAGNTFSPCPQQIVYGGTCIPATGPSGVSSTFVKDLAEYVGGNITAKGLKGYFLQDSFEGMVNTAENSSIVNLKSMQINTLKYTSNTTPLSVYSGACVTGGSSVVLGRFIPYQSFAPATPAVAGETTNVVTQTIDTYTDEAGGLYYGASILFYNKNYAQIIPYGVRDLYFNSAYSLNPAPKF